MFFSFSLFFSVFQEFSYGNATTEDLWKFLSSSSRKDVGSVMNSWIRELGFPVVKVSLEPTSGGESNNTVNT
jgi:aminopeptidase N